MLYPIAIEKGSSTTAYGVVVPDIPNCFSAGDSFDEALANAKDAIELHLEALAEVGELPPTATTVEEHFDKEEFAGWVWAIVSVDVEPYMGRSSKVNVTLPNLLTKHIDDQVEHNPEYKSRSHFLQVAAAHELQRSA